MLMVFSVIGYWLNETTCSKDAFRRGDGQMVIGFSFYGSTNSTKHKKKGLIQFPTILVIVNSQILKRALLFTLGYFDGIIGNLELLHVYYPGWVIRLYYDLDSDDFLTKVRV